ncbi:unnamed protein product [Gongylonema pulchrum]|uniref:Uncharacterized protein n=1 Tax=Gongylonema pulchrum TaxID=637853 RepID=A0A183EG70_9BILA|nr:unnamed protein product [Gongylonema pulchrum]
MAARCRRRRAVFAPAAALRRQRRAQGSATRGPGGGRRLGNAANREEVADESSQRYTVKSVCILFRWSVVGQSLKWRGLSNSQDCLEASSCLTAGPVHSDDERLIPFRNLSAEEDDGLPPPRLWDLLDTEWERSGGHFEIHRVREMKYPNPGMKSRLGGGWTLC